MIIRFLICFGLGAVPCSVLAMYGSGIDIRKVGSGNPGFNNVLRVSKSRAVWALVGDMGKGILALVLVCVMFPLVLKPDAKSGLGAYLAIHPGAQTVVEGWAFGFVTILGHCFSPFLKFKGGKGIATSAGVMLVLYPLFAAIALAYFVAARVTGGKLKWREAGAVASLSSWILFVLLMLSFTGKLDAACAAIVTVFLFWTHQKNLRQLFPHKQELPVQFEPRG